jgi:hypothetical protein
MKRYHAGNGIPTLTISLIEHMNAHQLIYKFRRSYK